MYPDRYRSPSGQPSRYGASTRTQPSPSLHSGRQYSSDPSSRRQYFGNPSRNQFSKIGSSSGYSPRSQSIIVNYLSNQELSLERFLTSEAIKPTGKQIQKVSHPTGEANILRLIPNIKSFPAKPAEEAVNTASSPSVIPEEVVVVESEAAAVPETNIDEIVILESKSALPETAAEEMVIIESEILEPEVQEIVEDISQIEAESGNKVINVETSVRNLQRNNFLYPKRQSCTTGEILNTDGKCVRPVIKRNVFAFSVPESLKPEPPAPVVPNPEIDYDVIFLKSEQDPARNVVVVPPPQQRTLVYILREDPASIAPDVIELPGSATGVPEVFYINYDEGENPELPGGFQLQEVLNQSAGTATETPVVSETVVEEISPTVVRKDFVSEISIGDDKSDEDEVQTAYVKPVAAKKFCCDNKKFV